jgi:hypothetical protein
MARTSLMRLLVQRLRGHPGSTVVERPSNAQRLSPTHSPGAPYEAGLTLQGYMEGGAAEEIRAANEVRRDLGV